MKRTNVLLTFLFVALNFVMGQSNDSIIKDIRSNYTEIRTHLETCSFLTTEVMGESTEGGEAKAYFDSEKLKLIEVVLYGETGKYAVEYYFNNGLLFFSFEQHFTYNRPIYWDKKMAEEYNDSEVFNPEKTIIIEDRYYFNEEKLIRWIDNDKNEVDLSSEENILKGLGLINQAYKTKGRFKK